MNKQLWKPNSHFKASSNLRKYERWLKSEKNLKFYDHKELWEWSVNNIEDFWESIWQFFDISYHHPYETVLTNNGMPNVSWFNGATLNYAEHIFKKNSDDRDAIIFYNEKGRRNVPWQELKNQVIAIQSYLIKCGIKKGDRVCSFLPNIPETISCFLAVNSLGAVWSCCSPDFGVETVKERFSQIEPKLFICCDGYTYANKKFDKQIEIKEIRAALPSIKHTLFIPYLERDAQLEDAQNFFDLNFDNSHSTLAFEPVDFNHPIWILYSSGTTGKPKAITHSHGGILLEHYKYMSLHNDVHENENFFWFSTTGWMMWNFMVSSLLVGASVVIYDGSPAYPNLYILWKIASELPIHHFGTSAPFLTACMKRELNIKSSFDMSALRSIGSTGAPLPEEAFEYIYNNISENVWLCSMSGGTDVCTAFVGGHPYKPVIRGRIQSRALGCALFAYNDEGIRIDNELGEMVIEKPMPSMPIYFWNDDKQKRYRESYFTKYDGKWRHGDWIKIYEDGSLTIHGRSDATLNRKGVRIGTSEIYSVLNKLPELVDSLIINIEQKRGGDVMPLFVMLQESYGLDDELKNKINSTLKTQCSPRHVPDFIIAVEDIPYTLSGKKMEVPVKKIFMGIDPLKSLNKDAVRNPEAIQIFIDLAKNVDF